MWETLAPRWLRAAEGQSTIQPKVYTPLEQMGFNTSRLRAWQPSEKDKGRIQNAIHIIARALREQPPKFAERKTHLDQQLSGTRHWQDVRTLAKTYLDGKSNNTSRDSARAIQKPKPPVTPKQKPPVALQQQRLQPNKTQNLCLLTDPVQAPSFQSAQQTITDFLSGVTELTLYLDESWHGRDTAIAHNEGVIAGVLCKGPPQKSFNQLPHIRTHTNRSPHNNSAIKHLWACSAALPVIFPLRLPVNEAAGRYYDQLLQHAIRFLLGWLLPTPRTPIRLHVFPEAIGSHPRGDTATDFYRGMLAADPTGRFANWRIEQLRWEEKDFGYTPYADLLAYLPLEHTDSNRALGAQANFKSLPGYVPFSLELPSVSG